MLISFIWNNAINCCTISLWVCVCQRKRVISKYDISCNHIYACQCNWGIFIRILINRNNAMCCWWKRTVLKSRCRCEGITVVQYPVLHFIVMSRYSDTLPHILSQLTPEKMWTSAKMQHVNKMQNTALEVMSASKYWSLHVCTLIQDRDIFEFLRILKMTQAN